jgi:hypothetical protein
VRNDDHASCTSSVDGLQKAAEIVQDLIVYIVLGLPPGTKRTFPAFQRVIPVHHNSEAKGLRRVVGDQIGKQVDGSHRVPRALNEEGGGACESEGAIAQGLPLPTGDKWVPKGKGTNGSCSVCHPHSHSGAQTLARENEVSIRMGAAQLLDRPEMGFLQLLDGVGKPSGGPHIGVGEGMNIANVGQAQAPALHPGMVVACTCTV